MNRSLRVLVLLLLTLFLGLAALGQAQSTAAPRLWAADQIVWKDDPALAGAKIAVTSGNPDKGAYGALHRWPAGTDVPMHYHTNITRGVVISGTLVVTLEGGSPTELPAGSYVYLPGKKNHSTTCKAGADCVFYAQQPGKGDAVMVK